MHHHLKNPRFLFQEGFLISFSSLALFLKTTCKAFISNSEWVCRFKVERFVKMVINKEKSNWNWAFQKNPLTSIAALKSLWLFEFSRQKLIIRVYNWKLEWKFKYWKKKSKWFLAWNKTFLLIFQTLCFACVFNYSLIKSLWVDIFSSSKYLLCLSWVTLSGVKSVKYPSRYIAWGIKMEPQNVLTRLTLELAAPEALEDCDIAHNFSLRSAVVNFFKNLCTQQE